MLMDFRTSIPVEKSSFELNPNQPVLLTGSCFSDNIGKKLSNAMWNVAVNPCGVLYNPATIASLLSRSLSGRLMAEHELVESDGLFRSWCFDTHFTSSLSNVALQKMNTALQIAEEYLRCAGCLIVTFGTSWVYELVETGLIVGNCHKFPSQTFSRRRLSVNEIKEMWVRLIGDVREINPSIKIIFTVSPIRHFKDGAHENSVSKSTLMLAIDDIISETENVDYFPAYELLIDDLRDYRFYADDMLHPSPVAIDYIWQHFANTYFSEQTKTIVKQASRLTQRALHRPITDNVEKIKKFSDETNSLIEEFLMRYPFLVAPKGQ